MFFNCWCWLHLLISIILFGLTSASGIKVQFSTNVTKITNGKPFLARCAISNYHTGLANRYRVKFVRTEGLIGTFELKSHDPNHPPEATFTYGQHDDMTVQAKKFHLPTYELEIQPKTVTTTAKSVYYCILANDHPDSDHYALIESNKWHANAGAATGPSAAVLLMVGATATFLSVRL